MRAPLYEAVLAWTQLLKPLFAVKNWKPEVKNVLIDYNYIININNIVLWKMIFPKNE